MLLCVITAPLCTVWLRNCIAHVQEAKCTWLKHKQVPWKVYRCCTNKVRYRIMLTEDLKIDPGTVLLCLLRLQSVLLHCLSVMLSARMLRQYFVCLSVFHMLSESFSIALHLQLVNPNLSHSSSDSSACLFSLCTSTTLIAWLSTSSQFTFSEVTGNFHSCDSNNLLNKMLSLRNKTVELNPATLFQFQTMSSSFTESELNYSCF